MSAFTASKAPKASSNIRKLQRWGVASFSKGSSTKLSANWVDVSSSYVSVVADYAAEIENSVGTEIYGPIFKAGIFIFGSGFISCFIAAFIVTQAGSWESIENEFTAGKEAQLISMDEVSQEPPKPIEVEVQSQPVEVAAQPAAVAVAPVASTLQIDDDLSDLDI